ncbi:ribonuclease H-like domain-containing protein [Xanthomonas campestris pv. raphani]|uniref:ribonuclease H-like domain-containing protein n=1 Tax=Xanthomonas campestris TaxID=339 RepID=UPI002368451C|nr:ribonuclease H-like domain-containing protein [Xanthomonas campestris]MEA9756076.1 ribonuclease H-like domain-containing protein [Xanthomonas campestris pv. raphani]MEA9816014.1 ribonuclease H-like domain-containing protein [Xanthomonas campestris pv. raphani]MEA9824139.1 ribonuclease H-like domain-containing protein [Xanthomonas campestris pv. raphani]MEA9852618.1 ribonuclease H-like domain-containing protein [Xanthomonas campestris pv. raphani]MEA9856701.1 ribonuclease H-like domain-conta
MSVSADRLRLLRRQAGQTDVRGPVGGEAATSARVEAADALRVDDGAGAAVEAGTSVAVGSGAQASVGGSTALQRAAVAVDGTRADSAAPNATAGEPLDAPSNAVSARDLATYAGDLQPVSVRRDAGTVQRGERRAASRSATSAPPVPVETDAPVAVTTTAGNTTGVSAERLRLLRRQVGGVTPATRKDAAAVPTRAQRQALAGGGVATSGATARRSADHAARARPSSMRDDGALSPDANVGMRSAGVMRPTRASGASSMDAAQQQTNPSGMMRRALQSPALPPARDASVFAWVEHDVRHKPAVAPSAGVAPALPTVQTPAAAPAMQRRADIGALRKMIGVRERAVAATMPVRAPSLDRDLPGDEIAPGLHLIEAFLPQAIPREALSLAFAKREDAVEPEHLLFFDTETTGLAGGTGTRAFMIGVADWRVDATRGSGLRVRQLMMSTMAAESAMLDLFRSWLTPQTVLSSYNGRCYDAPLLKTRYRLARRGDPISALDHVDLLFPTRRRYRGTWENCKLSTIERQLLRVVREDDLPGSEAPAAWLSYLRGGSARNLRRVADHNHQDVVTLSLLMQRLVEVEAEARATAIATAE